MTRTPDHTSGKAKRLSITLSPEHCSKLDALCAREGRTRSNLIARLLDRVPSS